MDSDIEYDEMMVSSLQLIWGDGFMAPGGEGHINKLLEGIETYDKRLLDIGTGLGGPALVMAKKFGAFVVGIDIEEQLIEIAKENAKNAGLESVTEFKHVSPGKFDFPDESFDIVLSTGGITSVSEKLEMYQECLRILKPGGFITTYDWMKPDGDYSDDMLYWFKMEELTYEMKTAAYHTEVLAEAGFENVSYLDSSEWYSKQVRIEYEKLKGRLYPKLIEILGQKDADHFVENWRATVVVCEKKEMLQVYMRGQKPR